MIPGLSWASLYAYIQARTKDKVRTVVFVIDVAAGTVRLNVNDTNESAAPIAFAELKPVLDGYAQTLPTGASISNGTVEIDYVTNLAVITVYYEHDGQRKRREQRHTL
jgi:hypothetical protein